MAPNLEFFYVQPKTVYNSVYNLGIILTKDFVILG
jgi:hypothetical protein